VTGPDERIPVVLSPGRQITDPDEAEALGLTVDARRMREADPGYYGRPVDDPDGEGAALDQEARDMAAELDQAEALTRERLAGGELGRRRDAIMSQVRGEVGTYAWPPGGRPVPLPPLPLDREGAPPLEWCETHQRRHMKAGHGDPEPLPTSPGAYLAISYPPRRPRMAFVDPLCGRELVVATIADGRLCLSYADEDLDDAARLFFERVLALRMGDVDLSTNEPVWHEAHTFDCAHTYAHGTCPSAMTTQAGHVGPWHQLFDSGWRRNASGAWECPAEHQEVAP
jgi:hypothetical protein